MHRPKLKDVFISLGIIAGIFIIIFLVTGVPGKEWVRFWRWGDWMISLQVIVLFVCFFVLSWVCRSWLEGRSMAAKEACILLQSDQGMPEIGFMEEVRLLLEVDAVSIQVYKGAPKRNYCEKMRIPYKDIVSAGASFESYSYEKKKNAVGRAIVGKALLGDAGAMIGWMDAQKPKQQTETTKKFYIHYNSSSSSDEIRTLSFSPGLATYKLDRFSTELSKKVQENVQPQIKQDIALPQAAQMISRETVAAPEVPPTHTMPAPDPAEELRKYKALADEGVITAEDYEAKKKQLLGL